MPIAAADLHVRLSGGAANADPNASLGGVMSGTDAGADIFDDVSGAESAAGDTEYRAVYLENTHATLTYLGAKVWVGTDTPSADTDADVALASEAVNTPIAETLADENTAPTGVTFTNAAVSYATGLAIGDIPPSEFKGVWLKRVVNPGAVAAADSFTVNFQGDTNA